MFCNQCGARLAPGVAYCTHCGKAVGTPAAMPPRPQPGSAVGRVTKHRNILGVLWVVAGVISVPGGLFMIGFSRFHPWDWGWGPWTGMPHFLGPLIGAFGMGFLIYAVLTIITGVGLLTAQSWARMLAIVMGIIRLIKIPFGTALGIYTLWVLLPDQSNVEYAQLAQQRARAMSGLS